MASAFLNVVSLNRHPGGLRSTRPSRFDKISAIIDHNGSVVAEGPKVDSRAALAFIVYLLLPEFWVGSKQA